MNAQPISRREFLLTLLRSRIARLFLATFVATLTILLALSLWQVRGVIGGLLVSALALLGLSLAWDLIPRSDATRAGWERRRQLAAQFPSYRYKTLFVVGLGFFISRTWQAVTARDFEAVHFIEPAICTILGAIAWWCWRRKGIDNV